MIAGELSFTCPAGCSLPSSVPSVHLWRLFSWVFHPSPSVAAPAHRPCQEQASPSTTAGSSRGNHQCGPDSCSWTCTKIIRNVKRQHIVSVILNYLMLKVIMVKITRSQTNSFRQADFFIELYLLVKVIFNQALPPWSVLTRSISARCSRGSFKPFPGCRNFCSQKRLTWL